MAMSGDPAAAFQQQAMPAAMRSDPASPPHTEEALILRQRGRGWRRWLLRIRNTMPRLFGLGPRQKGRGEPGAVAGGDSVGKPAVRSGVSSATSSVRNLTLPQSAPDADAVLRRLARRALGYSGADIERLVREARQKARREQRALTFDDLDQLLSASRPAISPDKRRRVAVHEAGHVLARILLDMGELTAVTIDTATGGFTEASSPDDLVDTEEQCHRYLVVTMAGRAAEQLVYGSTLSGSGGFAHSDLGKATQLATAMEVSLGFGRRLPLLYRDPDQWQALIRQDRDLARRVHHRLERAEEAARGLGRRHREQLDMIADELDARGTLEGPELAVLVEKVREQSRALA